MDMFFVQSGHQRIATVVTRHDGVRLSVPAYGPLDPIPHDLAHDVIDKHLGMPNGFWASVAAGALSGRLKALAGRQRPHAAEHSRAVLAARRQGIAVSEILVDAGLRAVKGMKLDAAPLPIDSPLVAHLSPALKHMTAQWQAIAPRETLHVVWPEHVPRFSDTPAGAPATAPPLV